MITGLQIFNHRNSGVVTMALLDTMGGRIRLARMDKDLNQLELLAKLKEVDSKFDIDPAHWSRVENNKRGISLELLVAVADLLEVSLDHLTGRPQYGHEVTEQFVTDEANQVARLTDKMDKDLRNLVLLSAENLKRLDEERKGLHEEIASLLAEQIGQMENSHRRRAETILERVRHRPQPAQPRQTRPQPTNDT